MLRAACCVLHCVLHMLHVACGMFFADTAALVHGLGGEDKDVIQRLRGGWFRIVRRHLCKGVALLTVNSHEYDGRMGGDQTCIAVHRCQNSFLVGHLGSMLQRATGV